MNKAEFIADLAATVGCSESDIKVKKFDTTLGTAIVEFDDLELDDDEDGEEDADDLEDSEEDEG